MNSELKHNNNEVQTFVIGDIHGRIDAFKQVLKKSEFDYNKDTLIILGDIIDGGQYTKDVIDEILKIKNTILIKGNHDKWFIDFIKTKHIDKFWVNQGGANTINSYGGCAIPAMRNINSEPIMLDINDIKIPQSHIDYLNSSVLYYKDINNNLFVHAGFDINVPYYDQSEHELLWNRTIFRDMEYKNVPGLNEIFIGHTTTQTIEKNEFTILCTTCNAEKTYKTQSYKQVPKIPKCEHCNSKKVDIIRGCTKPIKIGQLYCLDTGAGWNGRLTIMNVKTKDYYQSDFQIPSIL